MGGAILDSEGISSELWPATFQFHLYCITAKSQSKKKKNLLNLQLHSIYTNLPIPQEVTSVPFDSSHY